MRKYFLTLAATLLAASSVNAVVMTNGSLVVDITNSNGAIDAVVFQGNDFYNPGSPVSDFGLQIGTDTGSFRFNTTTGFDGIGMAVTGSTATSVTASGTYLGQVNVTRVYELVAGLNVLKVSTTLEAITGVSNLRLFDTADPNQGSGSATFNDRRTLAGGTVLQAAGSFNTDTTIWGFVTDRGGFSGGFGLGINTGLELNAFFSSGGFDPNGGFSDIVMAIGNEFSLSAGQSVTVSYAQAYGDNVLEAENEFLAYASSAAVPEPTSLGIWAIGLVGVGFARRRR